MKLFITLFISIAIFSSLAAMKPTETIQDNDVAHDWATQLCTDSFLAKARGFACYKTLMHGELSCKTKELTEEERELLCQLVQHNEWSYELHKKINQHMPAHLEARVVYSQIVCWAFGKEYLESNTVPIFTYKASKTIKPLKRILPQFRLDHINLYRKNGKPLLFKMLKNPDVGLASELIKIGANPDARCARNGNSALHELSYVRYWDHKPYFQVKDETAQQYYREFIALLTEYIDINVRNDLGQTPLHSTVGNMNFMKVLLAGEKVQINAQDKYGNTALHQAAYFFEAREYEPWHDNHDLFIERKHDKFGTLLLLYGANREIRNNAGLRYDDIIDEKREKFRLQKQRNDNYVRSRNLWPDCPCY